jgi:peptidoglycan/LPS O-acetylase OafA/YrhL
MAFVANYFCMSSAGGYFTGAAELKPLFHLWSLSVEEQFYVVWPLLLLVISRAAPRQAQLPLMRCAIGAIVLGSFVLSAWQVRHDLQVAFFTAPARAWELAIGALLALAPDRGSNRPLTARIAAGSGALLILASFTLLQSSTRFPGPAALPAVLGTALLIWGHSAPSTTLLYRIMTSRLMVSIGLTSYGWYLWHWPILSFLRAVTLMHAGVGSAIIAALIAYALAALSLKYVETPLRRGSFVRHMPPVTVLRWGAASIAGVALAVSSTWAWAAYGPRSAREQLAEQVSNDTPADANFECMLQWDAWTGTLPTKRCRFGAAGAEIDLVLWGDSHGMALAPLLLALQHTGTPPFLQLTMGNCLPFERQMTGSEALNRRCSAFNRQVLSELKTLKARGLKGVVLAGRWIKLWSPPLPPYVSPPRPPGIRDLFKRQSPASLPLQIPPADVLTQDLRATFNALQEDGLKVLVFLDPPEMPQPLPTCVYHEYPHESRCGISRAQYNAQAAQIAAIVQAVAADFPSSVRVFNPLPYLCDAHTCPSFINGRPLLWDQHHLAASTARSFAPLVANDFRWLQGLPETPYRLMALSPGSGGREDSGLK